MADVSLSCCLLYKYQIAFLLCLYSLTECRVCSKVLFSNTFPGNILSVCPIYNFKSGILYEAYRFSTLETGLGFSSLLMYIQSMVLLCSTQGWQQGPGASRVGSLCQLYCRVERRTNIIVVLNAWIKGVLRRRLQRNLTLNMYILAYQAQCFFGKKNWCQAACNCHSRSPLLLDYEAITLVAQEIYDNCYKLSLWWWHALTYMSRFVEIPSIGK